MKMIKQVFTAAIILVLAAPLPLSFAQEIATDPPDEVAFINVRTNVEHRLPVTIINGPGGFLEITGIGEGEDTGDHFRLEGFPDCSPESPCMIPGGTPLMGGEVVFNTDTPGMYFGSLIINSDDPDEPELTVPLLAFATAEIPKTINYQGYLEHNNEPFSGSAKMSFIIFNGPEGAPGVMPRFLEVDVDVTDISDGIFRHSIGSADPENPLTLNFNDQYWLEVRITELLAAGSEDDPEIVDIRHRQPLESVPYALNIPDGRITAAKLNIPAIDAEGKIVNISEDTFSDLSGSFITNIDGDNIASGTVDEDVIEDRFLKNHTDDDTDYTLTMAALRFPNTFSLAPPARSISVNDANTGDEGDGLFISAGKGADQVGDPEEGPFVEAQPGGNLYLDGGSGGEGEKNGQKIQMKDGDVLINASKTTGNCGIGETDPVQKLDVTGNAHVSGSVGIGNEYPTAKLHVDSPSGTDGLRVEIDNSRQFLVNRDGKVRVGEFSQEETKVYIDAESDLDPLQVHIPGRSVFGIARNGGASIGVGVTLPFGVIPPQSGLYVAGHTRIGHNNINPSFPEGLKGEVLNIGLSRYNPYTVPSGKTLYILSAYNYYSQPTFDHFNYIHIDATEGVPEEGSRYFGMMCHEFIDFRTPLVVKEGSVLSAYWVAHRIYITAVEVDDAPSELGVAVTQPIDGIWGITLADENEKLFIHSAYNTYGSTNFIQIGSGANDPKFFKLGSGDSYSFENPLAFQGPCTIYTAGNFPDEPPGDTMPINITGYKTKEGW